MASRISRRQVCFPTKQSYRVKVVGGFTAVTGGRSRVLLIPSRGEDRAAFSRLRSCLLIFQLHLGCIAFLMHRVSVFIGFARFKVNTLAAYPAHIRGL